MISKVPGLPDAAVVTNARYQFGGQYFMNGPRLLEFLGEMKQKVLSGYDILTVGETPLVTHDASGRYHARGDRAVEHALPVRAYGS